MRLRSVLFALLAASACEAAKTDEPEAVYPGFSGTWSGGESSGATGSGNIKFTVSGGTLTGEVDPISGSKRVLTGTVSGSGAITASLPAETGGCVVTVTGQITTALDGSGAASGSYTLVASTTCN